MDKKYVQGILFVITAGSLFVIFRQNITEKIVMPKYAWFQNREYNAYATNREPSYVHSWYTDVYKSLWDISNDFKNYWLYFHSLVNKTKYSNQTNTIDDGYISISSALKKLMRKSYADRETELQRLARYIRDKIEGLQNRTDCDEAKLLLCDVDNHCGFGCSLHTTVTCLMRAFLANRTLVFRSRDWRYAKEGYQYAFLPLGNCRNDENIDSFHRFVVTSEHDHYDDRILGVNTQRVPDIAWKIPSEIAPILLKLHGHPYIWWVSQFAAYVFRLNPGFQSKLDNVAKQIGFPSSAAGIQVRWGDKVSYTEKHEIEEYMFFIENWFKQLEMQGEKPKRIVYLSFENPEILVQLKAKFSNYKFITSRSLSKSVEVEERYQHSGLESVIIDIYFLSKCDYLVCTLSSNVCRAAYELMISNRVDAATRFQTIDTFYALKISLTEPWFARMNHDPVGPDEIELQKGDTISLNVKPPVPPYNDGFFNGVNERTKMKGRFPLFKARQKIPKYKVPTLRNYV